MNEWTPSSRAERKVIKSYNEQIRSSVDTWLRYVTLRWLVVQSPGGPRVAILPYIHYCAGISFRLYNSRWCSNTYSVSTRSFAARFLQRDAL